MQSEQQLDRRQRADRRRQGALLPDDLAHRRARQRERRSVEPVQGTGARVELRRPGRRTDLHVRRRERPGRAGRGRRSRRRCYNYQFSIQNAFADVDNALVASQKLKEQLAAQQRLVDALKDYARLARLQYDGGYTSYSTVLQAEQSLFPAELTLAAVRASVFASASDIYKAMGGGWVVAAADMTGDRAPAPSRAVDRNAAGVLTRRGGASDDTLARHDFPNGVADARCGRNRDGAARRRTNRRAVDNACAAERGPCVGQGRSFARFIGHRPQGTRRCAAAPSRTRSNARWQRGGAARHAPR